LLSDAGAHFLEGETPEGAKRRGGSPHAPRKASILERKSTPFKSNKVCENSQKKKQINDKEEVYDEKTDFSICCNYADDDWLWNN
jgi:hypothetical protein